MKHFDLSQPTPRHNPFIVPQGYFDDFALRMMRSIQQREVFVKHEMTIIRWIPWLGAACCTALMVFFVHTHDTLSQHQETNTHVASSTTTNNSLNNAEAAFDYYYNTDTKYWAYESDY